MVIKQVKRVDLTKEEKKVVQCLMRDLWEIEEPFLSHIPAQYGGLDYMLISAFNKLDDILLGYVDGELVGFLGNQVDCVIVYLTALIEMWMVTENPYSETCDFIHNEMDMDDEAGKFLVYTIDELMRVAGEVRSVALTGQLESFKVTNHLILLTLSD